MLCDTFHVCNLLFGFSAHTVKPQTAELCLSQHFADLCDYGSTLLIMLQLVRKGDQLIFKSLAVCISIVDERNGVIVIAASVFLGLLVLGI